MNLFIIVSHRTPNDVLCILGNTDKETQTSSNKLFFF